MQLKKLVVQGFKSFKDRTTIHFDDGITGIVGPNGCGKSNIVDALFWVMGEQSAKHLRGKSMQDLIFAGSSKYSPGAFAEATLVLDNTEKKHIHIGNKVAAPTEIQLTRKLYRNGETEYRINNEPARLKDIQEVFMDTGAGAKSYSIIAQGEINRLVQAKPEERRVMIEEVAGITKFKLRKRESLKKIEHTEQNLNRLHDLQVEIEKNLKALQKQAEKAERAKSLKKKIQRNDLVVSSHKVFDLLKSFKEDQKTIAQSIHNIEAWSLEKSDLESSLEEERSQKEDKSAVIEEAQAEYNEISKKLAGAEEKLNFLCKSQTEKEKQAEEKQKEAVDLKEEIENRRARLTELEEEKEELLSQQEEGFDSSELEERVELLKSEISEKEDEIKLKAKELSEVQQELQKVEQTIFQNNSKLEEYSAQLQDMTQEMEELEKEHSGFTQAIQEERESIQTLTDEVTELGSKEEKLKDERSKLIEELKASEQNFKEQSSELIKTESKLQSLKEINATLEGAKEGANEFLKEHKEGFSFLGKLITCDEKYSKAVQMALGDMINCLIQTTGDRELIQSWLETNQDFGLDLIKPMQALSSPETLERLQLKGFENITPLKEILTLEEGLSENTRALFDGYYVVDSITSELEAKLEDGMSFQALVSLDGLKSIRNMGGARLVSFQSPLQKGQGVIERNNQIEELEKNLVSLKEEVWALEEVLKKTSEQKEAMDSEYETLRAHLSDKKSELASKSSALESRISHMSTGQTRLDILKNRKSEISSSRLELMESEEALNNKQESLTQKQSDLEMEVADLREALEMQQDQYDQDKEELMEKKLQAQSFQGRLDANESQLSDVNQQIERYLLKEEELKKSSENLKEEVLAIVLDLEALELSNKEMADELLSREESLQNLKEDLSELLIGMQEREDRLKQLNSDINSTEKTKISLETKIVQVLQDEEQVVRDTFEKYRVDLRDCVTAHLEYSEEEKEALHSLESMYEMETEDGTQRIEKEPYEFNRRYGQDLKDCSYKLKQYKQELNRLGEINWQAVEDYERQKLRHDFLSIQEQELKKSLEDLETAITHIDEKSKTRFKMAFEEVDTRFRKVFPVIFGGGSAELRLTGSIDDLDAGVEIIAQPPGKKMQNINLMSGGEKAMTAVSLIFSIFLVKPSPFCLLDEVDAPLDDANVGRFNELLREMSSESQFILITHNKKTMELNDTLYGVTMQEPGISKAVHVQLH